MGVGIASLIYQHIKDRAYDRVNGSSKVVAKFATSISWFLLRYPSKYQDKSGRDHLVETTGNRNRNTSALNVYLMAQKQSLPSNLHWPYLRNAISNIKDDLLQCVITNDKLEELNVVCVGRYWIEKTIGWLFSLRTSSASRTMEILFAIACLLFCDTTIVMPLFDFRCCLQTSCLDHYLSAQIIWKVVSDFERLDKVLCKCSSCNLFSCSSHH